MTRGRGEVRLADAQFSPSHGEKNGSLELKKIFFGGIRKMARKKAQETEVKKTAAEAATKPVPGGAKATKGTAKTASSGKKTAKSGAKSAKSSEKGGSSGAKQTKSTAKGSADTKRKATKKTAPEAAADKPARTPRRKAADVPSVSSDSAVLDAAARLDAMEEEARTEAAQDARPANLKPAEIIYSLKAGAQIFVKTADIVAATGKTTSWIRDITARGIIKETKTKHGALYDFTQTMRAYCASLESRRSDDDTADVELKRKKAEAKLKESKAVIAEMQAKEFQGKMHRSEDVQKMTADLLYFVRGGLVALAGRCATDCAASSEPAEVQKIIEHEVHEILKDLSEYKYDPKRYDELVRQRTNRELDADFDDGEDEE